MAPTNETTTNISSMNAPLFSICQALDDLKDPDQASQASLATSLSALVATTFTCPFIIFLNVMVLLTFYRKPALRTQANVVLGAIAVNDLLRGVVGCPMFLAKEIAYQIRRQPNCYVNVMLFMSTSIASDVLLTTLNCERFLGLRFPMWHRVHVTKHRLLLAAVVSILIGLGASALRSFREEGRFVLVPLSIVCTIATFTFAILIWRVIIQRNQQVQPLGAQQNQSASVSSSGNCGKKAAKIATYLTVAFFVSRIIPLVMLTAIFTKHNLMYEAEPLSQFLSLINSIVNPLIYGLMNDNIKKACFELIKCK